MVSWRLLQKEQLAKTVVLSEAKLMIYEALDNR
jgi:hypothetical protein